MSDDNKPLKREVDDDGHAWYSDDECKGLLDCIDTCTIGEIELMKAFILDHRERTEQ